MFCYRDKYLKKDGGLIMNPQKCFTLCSDRLVSGVLN